MKLLAFILIFSCAIQSKAEDYLIIGDSHIAGTFGESLQVQLQKRGASASRYGLVGSSPIHYLSDTDKDRTLKLGGIQQPHKGIKVQAEFGRSLRMPSLNSLIQKHQPKVLVMEFGDNMAGYKNTPLFNVKSNISKQINMLKAALERSSPRPKCVFITNGLTDKDKKNSYSKTNLRAKEVAKILQDEVSGFCQVIRTTEDLGFNSKTLVTSQDGLHYTPAGGEKWANKVIRKMFERTTEMTIDCQCGL